MIFEGQVTKPGVMCVGGKGVGTGRRTKAPVLLAVLPLTPCISCLLSFFMFFPMDFQGKERLLTV